MEIGCEIKSGSGLETRLYKFPHSLHVLHVGVQFLIGGGRPGTIYHVNDISVYLGRQMWGGVTDQKNTFCACVLCFEPRAVHLSLRERSKLQRLGQKLQDQASSSFFRQGTPPPSVYLGRH